MKKRFDPAKFISAGYKNLDCYFKRNCTAGEAQRSALRVRIHTVCPKEQCAIISLQQLLVTCFNKRPLIRSQ